MVGRTFLLLICPSTRTVAQLLSLPPEPGLLNGERRRKGKRRAKSRQCRLPSEKTHQNFATDEKSEGFFYSGRDFFRRYNI